MTKQEYERLKAEATRDLEAIERVYRMGQRGVQDLPLFDGSDNEPSRENGTPAVFTRGGLLRTVKAAIERLSGNFTIHDIVEALEADNAPANKNSIRPALKKLEKLHLIQAVTQGIGRSATVYRKAR